jgi:hypothetical protein
LNKAKLQLEQEKNKSEAEINWFKAKTERDYKEKMAEEAKRRTEIEFR